MAGLSLFPDFSDEDLFPTFADTPVNDKLPGYRANTIQYLLASIGDNMTLSQSPTFICKDRSGAQFALTLTLPPSMRKANVRGGGLDFKGWKKGWTVVVRGAVRSGVTGPSALGVSLDVVDKDGGVSGGSWTTGGRKQGFVGAELGDVLVIPATLEKLAAMHNKSWATTPPPTGEEWMVACQACETVKNKDDLSRCKGCNAVWYCDKECQAKGWSEKDHKSECKVLKALKDPFLDFAKAPPPHTEEE